VHHFGHFGVNQKRPDSVTLLMPEAILALRAESAKKQFIHYEPSREDTRRSLSVEAHAFVGETIADGCQSITRIVLLSDPSAHVTRESYWSEPITSTWQNSFGATNHCQDLIAKFSMKDVNDVKAAAEKGEFLVATFSGTVKTKLYKVKNKFQAELGLR
jgi:hypothetical protein